MCRIGRIARQREDGCGSTARAAPRRSPPHRAAPADRRRWSRRVPPLVRSAESNRVKRWPQSTRSRYGRVWTRARADGNTSPPANAKRSASVQVSAVGWVARRARGGGAGRSTHGGSHARGMGRDGGSATGSSWGSASTATGTRSPLNHRIRRADVDELCPRLIARAHPSPPRRRFAASPRGADQARRNRAAALAAAGRRRGHVGPGAASPAADVPRAPRCRARRPPRGPLCGPAARSGIG